MAEQLISLGDDNQSVTLFGQWVLEDPLLFEMLSREKTAPKQKAFLEQAIKLGAYTLSISDMQVGLLGDLDVGEGHGGQRQLKPPFCGQPRTRRIQNVPPLAAPRSCAAGRGRQLRSDPR